MLEDAPDCTIVQDIETMLEHYVPSIASGGFEEEFDQKFPKSKLQEISRTLRQMVKAISTKAKTISGDKAAEKDLSRTWVRF